MNDLITDLKKLHDDTLNNLKLSKADNTLRAYKSDLYALSVLLAFELLRFSKVSSWSFFTSVNNSFIILLMITINYH